ncbi:multidrug effflux MFS transporter [Clavibacter michiganensis]|uniref:multidrug effflux MFS transporter n=1 Tax=Clavibacter michiganensis TaxID=28447 RepID=UPI0026DADAD2|nr:multidrug effflux MFS transporter [Clavibacter michiganensis]MDO4143046.1 multidrug effflux MFS transporter [Clavibacter michiganensis]
MSDDARHPEPDPRTSWTARRGPLLTVALIVGISPFATDLYIPGLPAIAADLDASTASVQLTLTAFLVAFAVGQLVIGPISDGAGRRRILLAGTALFTLASIVCAISPDATTLILARVVQGLGGAAAAVSARAMVGDASTGALRSRLFATLAVVNSVGPVVAPLVGGVVLTVWSWRAAFVVLAALGLALTIAAARLLPETLVRTGAGGTSPRAVLGRMAELLRIPRFRWYLITGCAATIGFFSYIATSSFVFQEQYGFGEGLYTLVFASNASCMIASTLVFRRLIGRFDEDRLFTIGLLTCAVGSALVLVGAVGGDRPGAGLAGPRPRHGRLGVGDPGLDHPHAGARPPAPGYCLSPRRRPAVRPRWARDAARGRPRRHRDRHGRADVRLHRGRARRAAVGVPGSQRRVTTATGGSPVERAGASR